MSRTSSPRLVRGVSAALALQLTAAATALAGPWALAASATVPAGSPPPGSSVAPAAVVPPQQDGPITLAVPGLWPGVVELEPLAVDGDGALEVPATASALGWWSAGPRPGEPGAAVVVGHVDLDGRPGVFAGLAEVERGALVVVGSGASRVRFRVVAVDRYRKTRFPADRVYRPTAEAELRLITCGGRFDPLSGHYEDNVVVRAVRA